MNIEDVLSPSNIGLLASAAACVGISKSGLAGLSMVHVIVFAHVFGARLSTGVLLPLLIVGDIFAVRALGRHAQWDHIRKLLPASLAGVVIGTGLMSRMSEEAFRPFIGTIILSLTMLQTVRLWRPKWFESVPRSQWFSISMGVIAGLTTMVANAAGPVIALYLLAVSLPKDEFVGTSAWFFLVLNICKIPFSVSLGLIDGWSLLIDAALIPLVWLGLYLGRSIVRRLAQTWFDMLLLVFTGVASIRLLLT